MKKTLVGKAPKGYRSYKIIVEISTERGRFSITGEIGREAAGCIHEEILEVFPHLKPLIDLHLSDMEGIPFHGASNGWFWLAKALGFQEKYGPTQSPEKCKEIFSEHIRGDADPIMKRVRNAADPKEEWERIVEELKPRWKKEAEEGLALIESL